MKRMSWMLVATLLLALCALPAAAQAAVTLEDAKAAALEHAGVLAEDALFVEAELEIDDGKQVYDLEFIVETREFDYEIDAATGEVVSFDADADGYDAESGTITADAALLIALERAGVTRDQVKHVKVERDAGFRRVEYEIEFEVGRVEYECEVDAASGAITEWDVDD